MTDSSRKLTSLSGTEFQKKHKTDIDEKNKYEIFTSEIANFFWMYSVLGRFVLQKAYITLNQWSSNMLKESPARSYVSVNTIQRLFIEGLMALGDCSNAPEFKYEVTKQFSTSTKFIILSHFQKIWDILCVFLRIG